MKHPWGSESTPDGRTPHAGELLLIKQPVPFITGWVLQSRLHQHRVNGLGGDRVVILEHEPVFTLGRTTRPAHWGGDEEGLRAFGAEVHVVNRGGSVTYHGPGQIVVYPIVQLAHYAAGPREFAGLLEEVILRLLRRRKIDSHRRSKQPGVWIIHPRIRKIASIGVRVERGVTMHGLALNVELDLAPFDRIHPCGLVDCQMTSMATELQQSLPIQEVKREIALVFQEVFKLAWPMKEIDSLPCDHSLEQIDVRTYAGA